MDLSDGSVHGSAPFRNLELESAVTARTHSLL